MGFCLEVFVSITKKATTRVEQEHMQANLRQICCVLLRSTNKLDYCQLLESKLILFDTQVLVMSRVLRVRYSCKFCEVS